MRTASRLNSSLCIAALSGLLYGEHRSQKTGKNRCRSGGIFADSGARLISKGLAEPDDACREANEILSAEGPNLPYPAAIVDEAPDMGEQAFRLIRTIVPAPRPGTASPSSLRGMRIRGRA